MRVVITGGAGFIGSYLVDHYINTDNEVIVIDNLITGHEDNIKQHLGKKQFQFLKEDVVEVSTLAGPIDLILHFASPASPFDYLRYPIETMKTASYGTHNMLELAKEKNAKFVLASTSEVYGDPAVHPQKEDYWGNVNPVGPRAVYDEGKRFAEAITVAYHGVYGVATNIVRIFNTYGERMREGDGRVIPTFVTQALRDEPLSIFGDGKQTRSFCYVSDMIRGITQLAKIDYQMPINLGDPHEFTIIELAEVVKELTGTGSEYAFMPLPQDDPKKRKPDISVAKELLNWEPEVGLKQGLTRVIEWFRRRI
ncbi:MAG: SDR family oxidoreductase [candidate division WOR-3 bacterium]|nr:MAG: SDR family oxidoreductase [candidate division WOR-3 bacterium]